MKATADESAKAELTPMIDIVWCICVHSALADSSAVPFPILDIATLSAGRLNLTGCPKFCDAPEKLMIAFPKPFFVFIFISIFVPLPPNVLGEDEGLSFQDAKKSQRKWLKTTLHHVSHFA